MPDLKVTEGLLVAYADGELDVDTTSAVEEAIRLNPELGERVNAFKASGDALRENFDAINQVTPDHIIYRIKEIEKKVGREGQKKSSKLDASQRFSWGFLSSLSGSFAAGIACAMFVVSSGLMPSNNDPFPESQIQFDEVKMVTMRGPDDLVSAYMQQGISKIRHGGTLKSNDPFSLVFKSPISGTYIVSEIIGDIPQRSNEVIGEIKEGENLDLPTLSVFGQETLKLRIEISNDLYAISQVLVFDVIP